MCILGDKIIFSLQYLQIFQNAPKNLLQLFFSNYFKDKICEVEGTICLTHFYSVVTSSLFGMKPVEYRSGQIGRFWVEKLSN
jgi:hypothetical protein